MRNGCDYEVRVAADERPICRQENDDRDLASSKILLFSQVLIGRDKDVEGGFL